MCMPLSSLSTLLVALAVFTPATAFTQAPGTSCRMGTAFYVDKSSSPRSATRLQYRDAHDTGRWWNKLTSSSVSTAMINEHEIDESSKQAVVDDYLEFLDRRYNRLHQYDGGRQEQGVFSAWKWLTQGAAGETPSAASVQQQAMDHDNALYALGVAGLASERLLQKHNLPVTKQQQQKFEQTVRSPAPTVQDAVLVSSSPAAAAKMALIFRRISLQRKLLIRYQTEKMQALARVLVNTIRAGPAKGVKAFFRLGGGGRTVTLTMTAVTAIFLLLVVPLVKTAASEGAQHA